MFKSTFITCIFFIFSATPLFALSNTDTALNELSKSPYWLKILHLKPHSNGYKNAVTSSGFYLSKSNITPKSELISYIEAVSNQANGDINTHPRCRFPERWRWIKQHIPTLTSPITETQCKAYNEWKSKISVESASLVFATGYLSNPASFYGHMLFKFGDIQNKEISSRDLLATSLNYGALFPPNENPIVYMTKGLFGGYDAQFTQQNYYEHTHNYADIELRDVWEYKLNLTRDEIIQIRNHSWELFDQTFNYYYLTENCGYRLAELVSIVLDKPLHDTHRPWSIPSSILKQLSKANHKGLPLLVHAKHYPSRENRFYERYARLTQQQKHILKTISHTGFHDKPKSYDALTSIEKTSLVDTYIEYIQLNIPDHEILTFNEEKRLALLERYQLSLEVPANKFQPKVIQPPHKGSPSGNLRIGISSNENHNSLHAGWRPAYFDMLSHDIGVLPYSTLEMMNFSADLNDDGIENANIDIINVETLNLPSSNLAGDSKISWGINFNMHYQKESEHSNDCDNCAAFELSGEIGKSVLLSNQVAAYLQLEGQIEQVIDGNFSSYSGVNLGGIYTVNSFWKMRVEYKELWSLENFSKQKPTFSLEQRFGNSIKNDVRLKIEKNYTNTIRLTYGIYF